MPYPGRNRLLARGSRWAYKLRDLFSTARTPAAGVRTCEPGPGTLRFVEMNGQLSIANGALVYPAQVSGTLGHQGVVGPGVSRVIGRTLVGEFQWSALGSLYFAFATAARLDTASGANVAAGFFANSTALQLANAAGVLAPTFGTVATSTTYQLAIVLRNPGALFYYRQGTSGNWTLLWVSNTGTTATLYPILSNLTNVGTLKNLKVVDLGTPFTGQNTPATNTLTNPSAGTTTTAAADTVIEWSFTYTALTAVSVLFRRQSDNEQWEVLASTGGALFLREYTGGTPTNRATQASVFVDATAYRVVVTAVGNVYAVYVNSVLVLSYTDGGNHLTTETGVKLATAGSAVSSLICWPRVYDLSTAIAAGTPQLNDQFTNSVSAGVYNLRAAEPGPGQWRLADGLGVSLIGGSTFQFTGDGLRWGDPVLVGEAMARVPGRALLFRATGQNGVAGHYAGWVNAAKPAAFDFADGGCVYAVGTTSYVTAGVTAGFDPSGYTLSTFGRHMLVLLTTGFLYCAEVNGVWKLLWVDETRTTTPLYPALVHSHAGGTKTYSDVAVLDLPAPWSTNNGAATFVASGSLSGGATAAHLPDTLAVFKLAAVEAGMADKVVRFRKKDANNYIKYRVFDNGVGCTAVLSKVVTGVETVLATYAGAFAYAATPRVTIIADGNVYRVHHNEVLASQVTDAGNSHLTEVSAEIASGTFSGLAFWPRYPPLPALL